MKYYLFFVLFETILFCVFCVNGEINCTPVKNYEICRDNETLVSVENKIYDVNESLYLYDKNIHKIKPNAFKI